MCVPEAGGKERAPALSARQRANRQRKRAAATPHRQPELGGQRKAGSEPVAKHHDGNMSGLGSMGAAARGHGERGLCWVL
ncbi:hypothetical protein O9K51_06968 [Purpureocillium lavendulum]|uniref:Uncharacterized protein n=1 Tax=Purpureocillium lavendulum TaxID=1247861 RepID=A0AB34FPX7_9HYPO|nr:hypothetical protein O9K51_06968 [Purpureocillium lavendulum]